MDLFGKILVCVNFGLSLLMAGVGGAVLYYRVDWTDTPAAADGSTPAGELVARNERVQQSQGQLPAADAAWRRPGRRCRRWRTRRQTGQGLVRRGARAPADRPEQEADLRGEIRRRDGPFPTPTRG